MLDLIYAFIICLIIVQIYLCIISATGIHKYNKSIPKKKRKRSRTPPRKSKRPTNIKIMK